MAWFRINNKVPVSATLVLRVALFGRAIYDINRKQFDEKFVRDLILPLNISEASFLLISIHQQVLLKKTGLLIAHYALSFLFFYFLLWSLGTPFFMNSDYFQFNCAVTSYLVLSTSKTFYRELTHATPGEEPSITDNLNDESKSTEGGGNTAVTSTRSRFDTYEILFNIAPRPSFALFFLFCSSSLYLLDWEQKWQIWPFLTVCGGFVGSVLDDLTHELSKS
jgi:hypothetical protein